MKAKKKMKEEDVKNKKKMPFKKKMPKKGC